MAARSTTFLIDECLKGQKFCRALRRAGLTVKSLEAELEKLGRTLADDDWIPLFSSPPFHWVIVTKDWGMLEKRTEMAAICESASRMVMFPRRENLTAEQMANRFVDNLQAINDAIASGSSFLLILFAHEPHTIFPEQTTQPV